MFKIEAFNKYIKENFNYYAIFIYDSRIQETINKNQEILCLNNIYKVISDKEIFVVDLSLIDQYEITALEFEPILKEGNSRFIYFFTNDLNTNERVVVIMPIKDQKKFFKRILNFNNLKAFL
jgi:hypothetical protein